MSRLRRIPRAGGLCAVVAFLLLLAWSLLTPPFHVPDEIAHYAYVQTLVETGKPPRPSAPARYSQEQQAAMDAVHFSQVIGHEEAKPIATPAEARAAERVLDTKRGKATQGYASVATANPPLFYLVEALPYAIARGGTTFDRIALMRLLPCFFGALTVLFTFMFLREVIPRRPWAWTVGALAVALQPLFGFISAGINLDAMLWPIAAGFFWLVARLFRRGLTTRRAVGLAGLVAAGVLTKLTFLAFVPAAVVAVLVLAWRRRDRGAIRAVVIAAVAGAVPVLVYVLLNVTVWDRPWSGFQGIGALATTGGVSPQGGGAASAKSITGLLSYSWQWYFPRLPFMYDYFPYLPLQATWVWGFTGRFGWLDYGFPLWLYDLTKWIALLLAAGFLAELVRRRARVLTRKAETVVYLLVILGLVAIIARAGYQARIGGQPPFEQARYLLPLLALWGLLIALVARAAGRHGRVLGALLVSGGMAWTAFAMVLTLGRYY